MALRVMLRGILILGAALFATGCLGAKKITTPSGRDGYAVRCVNSTSGCFEKAGKACGGGYEVISEAAQTDTNGWTWYDLTIECDAS